MSKTSPISLLQTLGQQEGEIHTQRQTQRVLSLGGVQQKHLVIFKKAAVIRENYSQQNKGCAGWILLESNIYYYYYYYPTVSLLWPDVIDPQSR